MAASLVGEMACSACCVGDGVVSIEEGGECVLENVATSSSSSLISSDKWVGTNFVVVGARLIGAAFVVVA